MFFKGSQGVAFEKAKLFFPFADMRKLSLETVDWKEKAEAKDHWQDLKAGTGERGWLWVVTLSCPLTEDSVATLLQPAPSLLPHFLSFTVLFQVLEAFSVFPLFSKQ